MKTNKHIIKKIACAGLAVCLAGCTTAANIQKPDASPFSWQLFKALYEPGKDMVYSPLSALAALGMTASGARNDTLKEIEDTTNLTSAQLNELASDDLSGSLKSANSVWLRPGQEITDASVQKVLEKDYKAEVFSQPFDEAGCQRINDWVSEKTGGLIEKMVDNVSDQTMMILLNALAFEDSWETPFKDAGKLPFTPANGKAADADMMSSEESQYVKMDGLHGFVKPYKEGRYAFAALVPEDDSALEDHLGSLDGDALMKAITAPEEKTVDVTMPRFEMASELDLKVPLTNLGINSLFDDSANLSGFGPDLFVSSLLQKAKITVDKEGTKAGAATEADIDLMALPPEDTIYVVCDRPFLYMIVDLDKKMPVFMGVVEQVPVS